MNPLNAIKISAREKKIFPSVSFTSSDGTDKEYSGGPEGPGPRSTMAETLLLVQETLYCARLTRGSTRNTAAPLWPNDNGHEGSEAKEAKSSKVLDSSDVKDSDDVFSLQHPTPAIMWSK